MAKITYPTKLIGDQFFATEANEIKLIVNGLDDAILSNGAAIERKLDKTGAFFDDAAASRGRAFAGPYRSNFGGLFSTVVYSFNIIPLKDGAGNYTGIWQTGKDGSNNGAAMLVGTVGLGTYFINIPSTGNVNAEYTEAQLVAIAVNLNYANKADKDLSINTQTASYTLQASDRGQLVLMDVASAHTVTVPLGLPPGFQCIVQTIGAGQTTFIAGSGMSLKNRTNTFKSAGVDAVSTVFTRSSTIATVAGDLIA